MRLQIILLLLIDSAIAYKPLLLVRDIWLAIIVEFMRPEIRGVSSVRILGSSIASL